MIQRSLSMFAALLLALPAFGAEVTGLRFRQAPDKLRVVFDVSAEVEYDVLVLEDPPRIAIDLKTSTPEASFTRILERADFSDTSLRGVRSAMRGKHDYRMVLDLRRSMSPEVFTLKPAGPYGHRLVVDLTNDVLTRPRKMPIPPSGMPRDVIVAVDAGHGGDDPGTLGIGKKTEKEIVLSIAKRLHRHINALPDYRAVMIRTGDYYVALRKRIEMARALPADVFVSVHADAAPSKAANGITIYTLSERGAVSEETRRLADLENNSDLIGGVSEIDLRQQEDILARVLLDMSMDANRVRSNQLGEAVVKEMGKVAELRPRPLLEAPFVVLKSPDVPSILVETGYLTNTKEYHKLADGNHQEKLAKAMTAGIQNFIQQSPPPGTRVALTQAGS
ncbi:MAG: N-acetylmuramoyl-L-alanine amidase [Gammaproteobacteria bacterium]|nr:N-acetylmuramoyl-L-alanine amidase [Gammaproteobacteria bacterium]MCY4276642.1 N-acetylmuramoyl-L-alanine amidase [Gammaproteobacteria bacterium]MCY4323152.1 N-acetylmuramoyl-L-alanine amidase [Gammaproteobacteria bacterium]